MRYELSDSEWATFKPFLPNKSRGLRMVFVGLDPDVPVEIEPGILLAAKNVADLRALTTWPPDLRLIRPGDSRFGVGFVFMVGG